MFIKYQTEKIIKMFRCYWILLFFYISMDSILLTNSVVIEEDWDAKGMDELNNALVNILAKCDLGLKHIFIYDISPTLSTVTALSKAKISISFILRKVIGLDDRYILKNPVGTHGFILILNTGDMKWQLQISLTNIANTWGCIRNCTLFVMPNPQTECSDIVEIFSTLNLMYGLKTYLICLMYSQQHSKYFPIIFTVDGFGFSKPVYWKLYDQRFSLKTDRLWTIYYCQVIKDRICQEFNFEKTNPRTYDNFSLGMIEYLTENQLVAQKRVYYEGTYSKKLPSYTSDKIENLEKLFNMTFRYFTVPSPRPVDISRGLFSMLNAHVDVYFFESVLIEPSPVMKVSHPVSYIPCSILSHDTGLSSPLEKIIAFYGLSTLASLIIVLIITSIVIWYKTKKISAVVFDGIRLLINAEILVPMNTLPLKIFFLMIFTYFIVIHSTLSGNLAKFLTIPASLNNIDTLDDLKGPRISKIYVLGCNVPELIHDRQLARKIVPTSHSDTCIERVMNDPNSVCISSTISFMTKVLNSRSSTSFYISKITLPGMIHTIGYQKGFILSDLFDWGIMVLSETSTLHHLKDLSHRKITSQYLKYKYSLEINFRPIYLKDLAFAIIFWSIGIALSTFCFLIEIFVCQSHIFKTKIAKNIFVNQRKMTTKKIVKITVCPKN